MLASSRERILAALHDDALVLDVGGGAVPFPRADWVIDVAPYEARGEWGYDGDPDDDRFSAETWVRRDICDREPWPFPDGTFDFAVCSHTLEDVRDPVYVCSELVRVARAGYVEVPSRLWEQSLGVQGDWAGFSHHRWLIDVDHDRRHMEFAHKSHTVNAGPPYAFPAGFAATLTDEERVHALWWEGSFTAVERLILDAAGAHEYLSAPVLARGWSPEASPGRRRRALRRILRARRARGRSGGTVPGA